MDYVLGFVLGLVVANVVIHWLARRALDRVISQMARAAEQKSSTDPEVVHTRVEMIDHVFFVFRVDNGEFLGQGKTLTELKAKLAQRYPNGDKRIVVSECDDTVLKQLVISRDQALSI